MISDGVCWKPGHAYHVDYFHSISSKTTAYIRNNATLNVLLGLSKRTSKTFFVALAKTYAGYCFAVNIYHSCKLKLQITMDRLLLSLAMSKHCIAIFVLCPSFGIPPTSPTCTVSRIDPKNVVKNVSARVGMVLLSYKQTLILSIIAPYLQS